MDTGQLASGQPDQAGSADGLEATSQSAASALHTEAHYLM